jgi:ribosomal protein S21
MGVQVLVEGRLEASLRMLRRRVEKDGIFKSIRLREGFPNLGDRKRQKWRIANIRSVRAEKRKAMYSINRRKSSYNRQLRIQSEANRVFALPRSIATDRSE